MPLKNETESLLTSLSLAIDETATKLLYETLTESQKNNTSYLSDIMCNSQGTYDKEKIKCYCDMAMFGMHCQKLGVDTWKGLFTFFRVIFGIIYGIFSIVFIVSLVFKVQADIKVNNNQKIKRMILIPKYIVIFNLIILSVSRFFFLVIDPFRQRGIASHLGDTIIFYLMVPTFLGFYFELFIVWSGINSVFVDEKLKKCFFSRRSTSNARGSLMIILFSILLLLILGFTIYLIFNLKSKIYKLFKDEDRDNFDIKIIKSTKIKSEKNEEIKNKDDIINFLTEIQKTDGLKVIDSVLTTNVQYLDDFEYKFFYDQEKMHLEFNLPNTQERDNMNTNANEETQLNQKKQIMRTNSNISMNNQPKMNFLTATDKRVVLKVFGFKFLHSCFCCYFNKRFRKRR